MKEILDYNKKFVEEKQYKKYNTSKYPNKKIAILCCMDARLSKLLLAALGLKDGDVIIIKNAGGVITHPFGSMMRSLLVVIYELGVEQIMVIGHTDCGVEKMNIKKMTDAMLKRNISQDTIDIIRFCNSDLDNMLQGFENIFQSVEETVSFIKKHPLIPKDIRLYGFVMDSETGELMKIKS